MAKFCSHCGAALLPDANFCAKCGTPVAAAAAPTPVATPVPPLEQLLLDAKAKAGHPGFGDRLVVAQTNDSQSYFLPSSRAIDAITNSTYVLCLEDTGIFGMETTVHLQLKSDMWFQAYADITRLVARPEAPFRPFVKAAHFNDWCYRLDLTYSVGEADYFSVYYKHQPDWLCQNAINLQQAFREARWPVNPGAPQWVDTPL